MDIQNLNFESRSQNPGDYHLGITVTSKEEKRLKLHVYLLSRNFENTPRTHMFGLVTILNAPNTPEDLLTTINPEFSKLTIKKNSLFLANQLITSVIVANFIQTGYQAHLWESRYHIPFDENSDLSTFDELMQADVAITVKDAKLIEHISEGMQWKSTSASGSPFWYLENYSVNPPMYTALYNSLGGKWVYHEGEIGEKGIRKPMKGMSVNYTKIPKIGEEWVANKEKEGYKLLYKNYDTSYYLEEEIRTNLKKERIANNKSEYSSEAFEAYRTKNVKAIKTILEERIHPDSLKDRRGDTLLYEIIDSYKKMEPEHFEMIQLLLSYGANPNLNDFMPLIHQACHYRNEEFGDEIIKLLLKHGAAIDSFWMYEKQTLVHTAARNGRLWLVEYLLQKGLDVNYKDKKNTSPLILAIQGNTSTVETLQFLLDNGADTTELYALHNGKTTLNRLMYEDRIDILNYLVSLNVDINAIDESGYPCIFDCAEYGPFVMFNELIKLGVDVEPHLSNIMHRIEIRLRDKSFSKDIKDTAFQKLELLYKNGYDVSKFDTLSGIIDSVKNRKKLKKYEEKMIISLLKMGFRHYSEYNFLAYINKINNTVILDVYNQMKTID
ncbi:ankyrin repeat domain-containing protein [uncultured Kordia sp.]|uniref:ankyrin repeat domain-containing protein n=1 Tax=uncultured Kordia sp. TaxID=507699 RepID=UPI0026180940|nr:ankyrin repeat domain-containing protein [uncultured Kordia sp.]